MQPQRQCSRPGCRQLRLAVAEPMLSSQFFLLSALDSTYHVLSFQASVSGNGQRFSASQMRLWHLPCQRTPLGCNPVSHVGARWLTGLGTPSRYLARTNSWNTCKLLLLLLLSQSQSAVAGRCSNTTNVVAVVCTKRAGEGSLCRHGNAEQPHGSFPSGTFNVLQCCVFTMQELQIKSLHVS